MADRGDRAAARSLSRGLECIPPKSPSSSSRFGSTVGFVLIALRWFYLLSLALLAGATINSLRHELHDIGELPYASPDN
jgi:uncharacterized BrkB/YihY/UPF0761 family membrane protein